MSGAAELVLPGVVHEPLAIRGPPSSGASLLPVGGELLFGEAIENPLLGFVTLPCGERVVSAP